jgi:hypothetical protein
MGYDGWLTIESFNANIPALSAATLPGPSPRAARKKQTAGSRSVPIHSRHRVRHSTEEIQDEAIIRKYA